LRKRKNKGLAGSADGEELASDASNGMEIEQKTE
jgi:hypothetical protein